MSQLRSLVSLLAVLSAGVSASIGPTANLSIVNAQIAPDGFSRVTTLAGGVHPGPIIRGQKNDQFAINVIDQLNDTSLDLGTSIHWHGLLQRDSNYQDGAAAVTQCPLVPGESYLYNFTASDQAGTFWYHSHFNGQYCDGLRGAFIVEDPDDPYLGWYDVDDDTTVISLSDWYHYLSTNTPVVPAFNSTLINGQGRYFGGPQNVPLAVVSVTHGVRYRFRVISMSCDPSMVFSIDGHNFTVIEVDGNNVQPLLVDSIEIFAGQRYSIILTANQSIGNYWIRSFPHVATRTLNFSDFTNVAILRYAGAPIQNPTPDPNQNIPVSQLPLVETNLHPLVPTPVPGLPQPGGADININLAVTFQEDSTMFEYFVNGYKWQSPTVPVLLQILSGAHLASDLVPAGSIYGVGPNQSVELTIPGGSTGGPHPMHLHGHTFWVVRSAGNATYNYENPVVRDVVSIGNTGDNVTIRFFTDNPGPWFLHCHIDWHLANGFAVVFAEDVPDTPTDFTVTNAWDSLCPTYNTWANITG